MACSNCTSGNNGSPAGCKSNGHCASGGCNKLNTFDWLSDIVVPVDMDFNVHEISFKNGSWKGFYINKKNLDINTGDEVAVETDSGFDVGRVSLSGELVRLQMKKKKVKESGRDLRAILRLARENDVKSQQEVRAKEGATMLKSRKIAREFKLNMKIGDVEYQADGRKATFYYTADERVDFRELIKQFAREFRVKVEMKQIGARQEAGIIGGIGSCGRELCCSSWLTEFRSVNTSAARYQNLSINQSKLSGQCGRLKCCLNYELNTYLDALADFPDKADIIKTVRGDARLIKTDVFKGLMYYGFRDDTKLYAIDARKAREFLKLNAEGKKVESLLEVKEIEKDKKKDFMDDGGQLSLATLEKSSRNKSKKKRRPNRNKRRPNNRRNNDSNKKTDS